MSRKDMPGVRLDDIALHYETCGQGIPLLLLHAGWGLAVNGFAYQQAALAGEFQMTVPDRRGYGGSTRVDYLGADFHWQAAQDMFGLLDAIGIRRACIWGHSDGAVIGALMAITQPERVHGLIVEGGHLYNQKPLSHPMFEQLVLDPTRLPAPAQNKLAAYHGADTWQLVIRNWAGAWLELWQREGDLYQGRLGEIICPTLVMHGAQDEHTTIGEAQALAQRIPRAQVSVYAEAGHCVHDTRSTRAACTKEAREFLQRACQIAS